MRNLPIDGTVKIGIPFIWGGLGEDGQKKMILKLSELSL
jgi:hypothetical protein